jgi:hypothetical protein
MTRYLTLTLLLMTISGSAQRFVFGIKQNVIGHKVTSGASLGILKLGDPQFHYYTDPTTQQDKFRYIFFKLDNQEDVTTEIDGSAFIPRLFIRYYGKNRFFFEVTHDMFRVFVNPRMVIGDVGMESQVRQDPIGTPGTIFVVGSYEANGFSLLPSFSVFLSEKKLVKPYLTLGAPLYFFKYSPASDDILSGTDFSLESQADRDFFFSKVNLNKVAYNYQVGLGIQFYDFFLESGYTNTFTSLQESGLFTDLPRVYVKLGANIFNIKKFFKNTYKNQVLPRERELY